MEYAHKRIRPIEEVIAMHPAVNLEVIPIISIDKLFDDLPNIQCMTMDYDLL